MMKMMDTYRMSSSCILLIIPGLLFTLLPTTKNVAFISYSFLKDQVILWYIQGLGHHQKLAQSHYSN